MPRDYKIFYGENISDEVSDHVERLLKDIYDLQFRSVGIRLPRKESWDSIMNAYDGKVLMDNVISDSISFFLWLIQPPLFSDSSISFGYAEPLKGAVVSTSRMATRTLVAKEVAYYVGLVLGLKNCPESCLMNESEDFETLIQKPSTLCNSCSPKFKRLKIRYM